MLLGKAWSVNGSQAAFLWFENLQTSDFEFITYVKFTYV